MSARNTTGNGERLAQSGRLDQSGRPRSGSLSQSTRPRNERLASRGGSRSAHLFTSILFLVFVCALLLALAAGVGVYRHIHATGSATEQARLAAALVTNVVRSKDAEAAVSLGTAPGGGQSLVLTERLDSGTFETRLYLYDGALVEEYVPAGTAYDPAHAEPLAAASAFAVELDGDAGALRVTCDDTTTFIALRSDGALGTSNGALGATDEGGAA